MTTFSRLRRAILVAFFVLTFSCVHADDILFVGNSYTAGSSSAFQKHGGVPKLFEEIAKAKGKQVTTDGVIAGGKDWAFHLEQPGTATKLAAKPWTWVVLQDHSARLGKDGLGFMKDGETFYERIVKTSPSCKIVLYETWARPAVFFKGNADGPAKMIKDLHEGYAKLQTTLAAKSQHNEVRVAPVGSAFWELEGKSVMNLHAADNHHANENGYYLAALVIYRTIYHESVIGAPTKFFNGAITISDDDAKKLQADAEAIVPLK